MSGGGFPLQASRLVADPGPCPAGGYVAAAMFTARYSGMAHRLLRSCRQHGVPLALWEVSAVHASISRHGTADQSFTKPNFIRAMLERFEAPVLYMDADCVVRERPERIAALLAAGHDFAIYNWSADRQTESYVPAEIIVPTADGPVRIADRFYRFASRFGRFDVHQLLCSGAVQLYGHTAAARLLLDRWHENIARFQGSADDHCLDFTFNNRGPELDALRPAWLPKEYARYAWWPYVRPVIDHPQFAAPAGHFTPVASPDGQKQFYPERCEVVRSAAPFPEDCLLDTLKKRLVRVENKTLTVIKSVDAELWLPEAAP